MASISILPSVNALLNSISFVFLILGIIFVKRKAITQHKVCMLAASFASLVFLACYLYYHYHHGSVSFQGQGWIRPVYFFILITHIVLAIINFPMVLLTLYRGLTGQIEKHTKIARVTFPMWLYVSVTGVLVYWMLYQMTW